MKWIFALRQRFLSQSSRPRFHLLLATLSLIVVLGVTGLRQTPLQAQSYSAVSRGNLWQHAAFPVENFQTYTSLFGYRISPTSGERQFHSGLDLAAPLGSYVRNWWEGQVIEVSDNTACGTSIRVQSGDWQHVYCHLMGRVQTQGNQRYLVEANSGMVIQQGQVLPVGARIGRVGMTGRTTGPHLHWGLKYGGNYIDPALVLQAMFQQQAAS